MSWRRRWAGRLGTGVLILVVFLGARAWQVRELPSGTLAPLPAALLDGTPVTLGGPAEAPTLVYFWGSWCGICRSLHGTVAGVADDHRVISVALKSGSAADLRQWLRQRPGTLPVVNDPDGRLAAHFRVQAVPTLFVLDGQGRIRFREVGFTSGWGMRARLWWAGVSDA